ncbi:hypothetical protein BC832DRAFT_543098 [Gaertneriomyces semiglobifer]|nr:hypothetical protein BC832DRAFT_543098 [Gaertneriomyces semiglobifer]
MAFLYQEALLGFFAPLSPSCDMSALCTKPSKGVQDWIWFFIPVFLCFFQRPSGVLVNHITRITGNGSRPVAALVWAICWLLSYINIKGLLQSGRLVPRQPAEPLTLQVTWFFLGTILVATEFIQRTLLLSRFTVWLPVALPPIVKLLHGLVEHRMGQIDLR